MAQQFCPNCGYPLIPRPSGLAQPSGPAQLSNPARPSKLRRLGSLVTGSWRRVERHEINSTAMVPWQSPEPAGNTPTFTEAERLRPARPQNAESDFMVPLLQALGTGFFVALAFGVYAYHKHGFTWDIAVGLGILASGGYWLVIIGANRKLLWIVERIVNEAGQDSGPEPPPPAHEVTLNVVHQNSSSTINRVLRFDLPAGITEDDLLEFARGVVLERRGLAESAWTGTGKPFSKPKYSELLDVMDRAGLVRWCNPNAHAQGRQLTSAGGRALRSYLQVARTHAHADSGSGDYAFVKGVG